MKESLPAVPLYQPNPVADAAHDVAAPGGYEWWYFDAEEASTDTQIVAIFLQGFVFHPEYLRRYGRYLKSPTRHAPPVPNDYLCAYFCVYRNGKVLHQFMTHYPPDHCAARRDRPEVSIGPNHFESRDGKIELMLSGTPWRLTLGGPKVRQGRTLSAQFTFTPVLTPTPVERRFFSRPLAGADHHWVVANPLCDVQGSIQLTGQAPIAFNGRGYHDHNYGTGPIGPGLKRWFWGRALLKDRALTFHFAHARDWTTPDEIHLLETDHTGSRVIDLNDAQIDWSRRSGWLLAYPLRARFADVLTLTNPRLIDSAPFYLRLIYDAEMPGRTTTALTEIAYPHRLRWPILGRMIEMSIHKPAGLSPATTKDNGQG